MAHMQVNFTYLYCTTGIRASHRVHVLMFSEFFGCSFLVLDTEKPVFDDSKDRCIFFIAVAVSEIPQMRKTASEWATLAKNGFLRR